MLRVLVALALLGAVLAVYFETRRTGRHCPGRRGRLSALSVFQCKSVLYGAFVWARRALNRKKQRLPARAVRNMPQHDPWPTNPRRAAIPHTSQGA